MNHLKQGFVKVLKPGICSIQDSGRFGYLNQGVPQSGFMNDQAASLANLLVDNNLKCACLEWAYLSPKLYFLEKAVIAVTGVEVDVFVNHKSEKVNKALTIQKGDTLSFGKQSLGVYGYISIKGGFQTENVLGSFSWSNYITSYTILKKGMELPFFVLEYNSKHYCNLKIKDKRHLKTITIEAIPGPEFTMLTKKEQVRLKTQQFHFSNNSNRMGIRLSPNFISHNQSIISSPVLPGTVQWTPSGQLIVLMKEAQTIGGYPRVLYILKNQLNNFFLSFDYMVFSIKN